MPVETVSHHEELATTTALLAHKVNRTVLQQALVESRLFAKNADQEEIRRLSRTQSAWVTYVMKMLDNPDTRAAAFRALSILVSSYVKRPALDQRVESALRKAKQAAERGDTDRLQREVGKLRQAANDLNLPELYHPAVVLLMWASSELVRGRIADVSRTEGDVPLGDAPVAENDAKLRPIDVQKTAVLREANSTNASLIIELKAISVATPPSEVVNWRFRQAILDEALPSEGVAWPALDHLAQAFAELKDVGSQLAGLPASNHTPILQDLPAYRAVLERAMNAIPDLESTRASLATIEEELRQVVRGHIEGIDGPLKTEIEVACQLFKEPHSTWSQAITGIDAAVKRNWQIAAENRSQLLHIEESIEQLAEHLPLDKRTIAESKVRHLVRLKRIDELQNLEEQLKQEVLDLQNASRRIREAATTALSLVDSLPTPMSSRLAESLLTAVNLGDAEQARTVIVRARREAEPIALGAGAAQSAIFFEQAPTLRFDDLQIQPRAISDRLLFIGRLEGFVPRDRVYHGFT